MLIDTHCHLDLLARQYPVAGLLDEARSAGIGRWVVPGVAPEKWGAIAQLSATESGVLPAYGIHPGHAATCVEKHLEELDLRARQAVAIGEIGLDDTVGDQPAQEALLREQLRIAHGHGLPLLIHCRGMIGRLLAILREERAGELGGIMHAFAGSIESAREAIRIGFAISLSGTLTWHGAHRPVRLACELPLDQLVVESDAPDLTPQAYRGQVNRPAWLTEVVARLAEIRGVPGRELADRLTENSIRVLRLDRYVPPPSGRDR